MKSDRFTERGSRTLAFLGESVSRSKYAIIVVKLELLSLKHEGKS